MKTRQMMRCQANGSVFCFFFYCGPLCTCFSGGEHRLFSLACAPFSRKSGKICPRSREQGRGDENGTDNDMNSERQCFDFWLWKTTRLFFVR